MVRAGRPAETDRHAGHFLAWYVRGVAHDNVGQLSEAAAAFTVCAALKPEMPWAYFSRGLVRLVGQCHSLVQVDAC